MNPQEILKHFESNHFFADICQKVTSQYSISSCNNCVIKELKRKTEHFDCLHQNIPHIKQLLISHIRKQKLEKLLST